MTAGPTRDTAFPSLAIVEWVHLLRNAGGALFDHSRLHGELARVELEQEKRRLLRILVIVLLGFAALLCAMFFGGLLVLAAAWDTPYRLPATFALVLGYGGGSIAMWRRFQSATAGDGQAFAASREEFAADVRLLRTTPE